MGYSAPRGERFSVREGLGCAVLSAALGLALGAWAAPGGLHGELINPDSAMRLVRLRDMLAAGAPLDAVARDGSGAGVVLHWSHLLDSLLLALAAPLAPGLGWERALRCVAICFGPLCMGALGAALAWSVAPITDRGWRLLAPVLAAIAPPLAAYGLPGVVHHHVLLALSAVMVAGWAGRAAAGVQSEGRSAGAWGAAGLWLSPETVPFTLAAFAAIVLAWLVRPGNRGIAAEARDAGTWFLIVIAAALAVDPPRADPFAPEVDRLSTTWLALASACALAGWLAWLAARQGGRAWQTRLVGAAAAMAPLLAWFAVFPAVLLGPGALMPPTEARAFLGAIAEMQPVRDAGEAAQFLATGLLAVALAGLLAWWNRNLVWAWAALCALATVALGAWHVRFAAYPAALGAMALPVALTWLGRAGVRRRAAGPFLARPAMLLLFLAGPLLGAAGPVAPGPAPEIAADATEACARPPSAALLAQAAGQVVLADPGETPDLLYRTSVFTVGSLYHRGIAAYMRLRAAWRSGPADSVPTEVRATGARWVLLCPGLRRSTLVADLPCKTLEDRLRSGVAPPWLEPAGADVAGWRLWRIADPSCSGSLSCAPRPTLPETDGAGARRDNGRQPPP